MICVTVSNRRITEAASRVGRPGSRHQSSRMIRSGSYRRNVAVRRSSARNLPHEVPPCFATSVGWTPLFPLTPKAKEDHVSPVTVGKQSARSKPCRPGQQHLERRIKSGAIHLRRKLDLVTEGTRLCRQAYLLRSSIARGGSCQGCTASSGRNVAGLGVHDEMLFNWNPVR